MEHPLDLVLVHLCSLLAPVGLFLLHAVLPGGFVGSPLLAFSLLSLLLSAATLLASRLLPFPRGGLTKVSTASFIYAYLLSVLFYQAVGILLGANPISQCMPTLIWASLMTSLTSVPTTLLLDTHWKSWIRVLVHRIFQNSAERNLYITIALTVLGAWLGAIPIPLDWNRPWQVWPIPCSCGAILGGVIGSASSLLLYHYSLFPPQLGVRQDMEKTV